jgi:hypothetical protein
MTSSWNLQNRKHIFLTFLQRFVKCVKQRDCWSCCSWGTGTVREPRGRGTMVFGQSRVSWARVATFVKCVRQRNCWSCCSWGTGTVREHRGRGTSAIPWFNILMNRIIGIYCLSYMFQLCLLFYVFIIYFHITGLFSLWWISTIEANTSWWRSLQTWLVLEITNK